MTNAGQLSPGYLADLLVVSLDGPSLFPAYNPYSALVYGAGARDVALVMTGGQVRVRNGQLTAFDLYDLRSELRTEMPSFQRAAEKYADII